MVMTNSLPLNMAIEIVDLPMKHGRFFHSYVGLPEGKPLGSFMMGCILLAMHQFVG